MQVELSLDELKIIDDALGIQNYMVEWDDIHEKIQGAIEKAEELESIDLNDCAGGACKL